MFKSIVCSVLSSLFVVCVLYFVAFDSKEESLQKTKAWKDAIVVYELENYQLKDGVVNEISMSIVSKPGWSYVLGGNRYIIYNIEPERYKLNADGECSQCLQVGLLDHNNQVVDKRFVLAGVKEVTDVFLKNGEVFVSAIMHDDSEIVKLVPQIEAPKPLPDMRKNPKAYLNAYASKIRSLLRTDYRPDKQFSALDYRYYDSKISEALEKEKLRMLDLYDEIFGDEEGLTNASQKLELVCFLEEGLTDLINKENEDEEFGISTSQQSINDYVIEEAKNICWDNYISAIAYPENWRTVRNLKGVFRGFPFEAKDGIVIFRANVKNIDTEEKVEEILILRLLWDGEMYSEWCYNPKDFSKCFKDKIKFELIDPNNVTGTYKPETGYFVCRDGIWVEEFSDSITTNGCEGVELLEPFKWQIPVNSAE